MGAVWDMLLNIYGFRPNWDPEKARLLWQLALTPPHKAPLGLFINVVLRSRPGIVRELASLPYGISYGIVTNLRVTL